MKNHKEENRWVDIHDDNVMREMGLLRPFEQSPRDKSVWTKTPYEKRILSTISRKGGGHFHSVPSKFKRVPGKLVIYLKKNNKFPKTTYSRECWESDIPNILSKYPVAKYSWNNKTYTINK